MNSLALSAQEFNKHIRKHWSMGNSLHWQLDVRFQEDRCRITKDHAPENMACLRKMSLQGLLQVQDKQSIKSIRKMAGWNDQYFINILKNMRFYTETKLVCVVKRTFLFVFVANKNVRPTEPHLIEYKCV